MALEAAARVASVSVMPPTPEPTIFTFTSSVESLTSASQIASTEPLYIGLDHHVHFGHFALSHVGKHVFQLGLLLARPA